MNKGRVAAGFALGALGLAVLAYNAEFAFTDLASLLHWVNGPWGEGAAIAIWGLGVLASVPLGSLVTALEGVALAAGILTLQTWSPQWTPAIQSCAVLLLLVWMASFAWRLSRLVLAELRSLDKYES